MQIPTKPYDNKRIFWDVDASKLNFEKRANFIIERVFERGDVEDIRMCLRYYGDEVIVKALKNAKWLRSQTIQLATALFDNEPEDYRCYTLRQLNSQYWPY
jgi:hypothetical protein